MQRHADGRKLWTPNHFPSIEWSAHDAISIDTDRPMNVAGPLVAFTAVIMTALVLVSESHLAPELRQASWATSYSFP